MKIGDEVVGKLSLREDVKDVVALAESSLQNFFQAKKINEVNLW